MKAMALVCLVLLFVVALLIHYLLTKREYFLSTPPTNPDILFNNPDLSLNRDGPSLGQYVIKHSLIPDTIALNSTFNAGATPIKVSNVIKSYNMNDKYNLGDIILYNGKKYISVLWNNLQGSPQSSPDTDKNVWKEVNIEIPSAQPAPAQAPVKPAQPAQAPASASNGLKFSELTQSLLSYSNSPNQLHGGSNADLLGGSNANMYGGSNANMYEGSNTPVKDISSLVHNEVKSQLDAVRKGPKDVYNTTLVNRSLDINDSSPQQQVSNSDSLQQGSWFRTASDVSPYAEAQRPAESCPHDMSQYIRKDNIPCWACKIK
jgi:hypothetical protein